MAKAAVMLANGFEEAEAILVVDILRRAGVECDMVGLTDKTVLGAHKIPITADAELGDNDLSAYDAIVLPGGLPGATNLRDDARIRNILRAFAADPDKFECAICAAPIAFAKAGIAKGKKVTSYPGAPLIEEIKAGGAEYVDEGLVTIDGHMITSRGPATALAFGYAIAEALGGDADTLKEEMLYDRVAK